jgi:hypothetical protein
VKGSWTGIRKPQGLPKGQVRDNEKQRRHDALHFLVHRAVLGVIVWTLIATRMDNGKVGKQNRILAFLLAKV